MRLLVLGGSGQVGHCLLGAGRERGHDVIGTTRRADASPLETLDLRDGDAARRLVRRLGPDHVVNCAAWSHVDGNEADPRRAIEENVATARNGARAAAEAGAGWTQVSTSYVFDGRLDRPYREEDPPCPGSAYGRTKLQAEQVARETCGARALVIRTIVVFGPDPGCKSFVHRLVEGALARARGTESGRLAVASDQLGNPTYGPDLAACLIALVERGERGTWNVAGPEPGLDRAAFARLVLGRLGLDPAVVDPTPTDALRQQAPRPRNASLDVSKLEAAGLSVRGGAAAMDHWRTLGAEWPWPDL